MHDPAGWNWLQDAPAADPAPAELAPACARLFATADGKLLLAHLRRTTVDRTLGASAGDAALRMLEGQRALVLRLEALARPAAQIAGQG